MATSTITDAISTPADFARAVLAAGGYPVTQSNVDVLVAWEAQEGGHWHNSRRFNPLNTTAKEPGATYGGAQGNIASYTSWAQGVAATVQTLAENHTGYANIRAALMQGNNPQGVANAIVNSVWGTKTINLDNKTYHPGVAQADAAGGNGATGGAGDPAAAPAKDWLQYLDSLLNPNFGWNPFGDVKDAIGLAVTRGGLVVVGLILIGGGVLLAFGRDIFGGLPIPGATEIAGPARRAAKEAAMTGAHERYLAS